MGFVCLAFVVLAAGGLAAQDAGQQRVRLLGDISSEAGQSTSSFSADSASLAGANLFIATDGSLGGAELWRLRALAKMKGPQSIAADSRGNIYVADTGNHCIRRIDRSGVVSTFAGRPNVSGYRDGFGVNALFNQPVALAVDVDSVSGAEPLNHVYVADKGNHAIRRIRADGAVETIGGKFTLDEQGTRIPEAGFRDRNQSAEVASFRAPESLALSRLNVRDALPEVFVADTGNHAIRRMTFTSFWTVGLVAGANEAVPEDQRAGSQDGELLTARFNSPCGISLQPRSSTLDARFYILDRGTGKVRRLTPYAVAPSVQTLAGITLNQPVGLAVDTRTSPATGLFVTEQGSHAVSRIGAIDSVAPTRTLLAGGTLGSADGVGAAASFNGPAGLCLFSGQVVVADGQNHALRALTIPASGSATVSLFAGVPTQAGSEDGGTDSNARAMADGSPLTMLTDLRVGVGDSLPTKPVAMQRSNRSSLAFFTLLDDEDNRGLWCSDGSPLGTFPIKADGMGVIQPGSGMAVRGQTLFFVASDALGDNALWQVTLNANGLPGTPVQVSGPKSPVELAAEGNLLLMRASDGSKGLEPWANILAGNTQTTLQLQDLNVGSRGSQPSQFVFFNKRVYFSARSSLDAGSGDRGLELHVYDPALKTAPVISQVADLAPASASSDPRQFVISGPADSYSAGGRLFFTIATDNGIGLCMVRQNQAGVDSIDLVAGPDGVADLSFGSLLRNIESPTAVSCVVGGALKSRVVFIAQNVTNGRELFYSDGFGATGLLSDITSGTNDSDLGNLNSLGAGRVIFTQTVSDGRQLLWATDGVSAAIIEDFDNEPDDPVISKRGFRAFAKVGSQFYFMMGDDELWRSDGLSDQGTTLVHRFRATNQNSDAQRFTALSDGRVVFDYRAPGGDPTVRRLRVTNADATQLSADVTAPEIRSPSQYIPASGGRYFFAATISNALHLMMGYQEANGGQESVADLGVIAGFGHPVWAAERLFFVDDGELKWLDTTSLSGPSSPALNLIDLDPLTKSNAKELTYANGRLWFAADAGAGIGVELFVWDPLLGVLRANEGKPLADLAIGQISSSNPEGFVTTGIEGAKRLYFVASGFGQPNWLTAGRELFVSNARVSKTTTRPPDYYQPDELQLVKDISPNRSGQLVSNAFLVNPRPQLIAVDSLVYFEANDGLTGQELWRSDGTAAGTVLVKDIRPGVDGSSIRDLAVAGGKLFYVANDGGVGGEALYSVVAKGSQPMALTKGASNIANLCAVGDVICFTATVAGYGNELWVSDGTLVGTRMLHEFVPGVGSSLPHSLHATNPKTLLLSAQDDVNGDEPRVVSLISNMDVALRSSATPATLTALTNAQGLVEPPPSAMVDLTSGGSVPFGAVQPERQIVLTNSGSRIINQVTARVEGVNAAEFVIKTKPSSSIFFESSTVVGLQFVPREGGMRSARLVISSTDDSDPIFEILLQGNCSKDPTVNNAGLQSQMVAVGSSVKLTPSVTSATPASAIALQWLFNGKAMAAAPTQASAPELYIHSARLADAGSYQARFTRDARAAGGAGIGNSNLVQLGVAESFSPARIQLVRAGAGAVVTCNAAGSLLTFQWRRVDGLPLPLNATGASTRSLTIPVVGADLNGVELLCAVGNAAGSVNAGQTRLSLYYTEKPVVSTTSLPVGRVGAPYTFQIRADKATAFSATPLPRGLTLNAATGVISGVPSAAITIPEVTLVATLGTVKSDPVKISNWVIQPAPANLAGVYQGWVDRHAAVNDDVGARLELTVAATGTFSGRLTVGITAIPFTGNMTFDSQAVASNVFPGEAIIARALPLSPWKLTFAIDATDGSTIRSFAPGAKLETVAANGDVAISGNTVNAPVAAWRAIESIGTLPGRYHLGLKLPMAQQSNPALPKGHGFVVVTVDAKGVATLTGNTADGERITGSTFVGHGQKILLYQGLYATPRKGSLMGELTLRNGATRAQHTLTGNASWTRPAQVLPLSGAPPTRTYRSGFGLPYATQALILEVAGGLYSAPALVPVQGNPAINPPSVLLNAAITGTQTQRTRLLFDEGGLTAAAQNPDADTVTLSANSATKVEGSTTATTLSVVRATGLMSGGFTLKDPNAQAASPREFVRAVRFSGLIVPRLALDGSMSVGGAQEGIGFFMLPQIPSGPQDSTSFATSSLLSGSVLFELAP